MKFLKKYPWLPLLILNLLLAGSAWLFFLFVVGAALNEEYHPDQTSRSLFPLAATLFLISISFLLASLLAWFKWRHIPFSKVGLVLVAFFVLLGAAGSISHQLTEVKPEYRVYEHRGFTYQIPREYSPSYWKEEDRLEVKVCDQDPTKGYYQRSALYKGACGIRTSHYVVLTTRTPQDMFDSKDLRNGTWGFSVATTSGALVLTDYNPSVAEVNNIERIEKDDYTIIRSSAHESLHTPTIFMEVEGTNVRWLSMCSVWTCNNYRPLADDPGYSIMTEVENRTFREVGFLTEEEVEEYKRRADQALVLFDRFRVAGE